MSVDDTLSKINGKGGTIQQLNESLVRTKDLITLSQATLYKQQKSIANFDIQISNTLTSANSALAAVKTTADTTSTSEVQIANASVETIQGVQPVLSTANQSLQQIILATNQLNKLVSDPEITQTITNVNSTTKHLDTTSKDVEDEVHSLTHPTWAHKIFSWSLDVVHAVNPF